jgi:mobilome CxxCx(11)CxxC protein
MIVSTSDLIGDLEQRRFDIRCGILLHKRQSATLDRLLTTTEVLSLCIPILFFAGHYIPDSSTRNVVLRLGEIAAVFLIAWAVASLALDWKGKLKLHQKLLSQNFAVGDRVDSALRDPDRTKEIVERVIDETTRLTAEENQLMPKIRSGVRRSAYSEALRQTGPHVSCPVCGASPWKTDGLKGLFRGRCEACGRTNSQDR